MLGLVYARTSKDTDDAYSVSSQVDACLDYAKRNNITVPDEYVFREDISGTLFERPEYSRVQKLIKSHAVSEVIVYATDRLARKSSVSEIYLDEMSANDVSLHILAWGQPIRADSPEDLLRFGFESQFSSFERNKIKERTMRGKVKKASMGKVVAHSRPLFGYSLNEYKDNFVLNEYAPIVREILFSYGIEHISPARIADNLQARGIPTPGEIKAAELESIAKLKLNAGKIDQDTYEKFLKNAERFRSQGRWINQTIYNILVNARAYAGDYEFALKKVTYHVSIPPIIESQIADAVEHMLTVGRRRNARKPGTGHYLMARRLSCGICNYSYGVAPKKNKHFDCYYRCTSKRNKYITGCSNKPIRNNVIDPMTKNFIRELLLNPDNLFTWWQEQNKHNQSENEKLQESIDNYTKRILELQSKLYRTLDRLTDKLDADEYAYYSKQKEDLRKLIAEYKEDKEQAERSLVVTSINPEAIQELAEMGKEYREVLMTSDDFSFWRGLVDDLDLTGIIGVDDKGQYIEFVLMGNARKKEYVDTELVHSIASKHCFHFRYYLSRMAL